jgi:K(+)-stimulated pyrophosphate-energized sodium pump
MALISAYMEEVRLWFGKIAKGVEGEFITKGEYIFYNDIAPAAQEGFKIGKNSNRFCKRFSCVLMILHFLIPCF